MSRNRASSRLLPIAALAGLLGGPVAAAAQVAPQALAAVAARNIGPAGMSGRVAAVDVVRSDPDIIFVGSATGGLFRSRDGGITWQPVFDDQPVLGIGAISVFQANPDIVWVGTGEGNPRNSAGVGRGIFRSLDGGDTWEAMGLEASERIARVVTDPDDPDRVWVAAMGPAWSDGDERGVFRTIDGGRTWERVLEAGPRTGAADLVMDPTNPEKLYAALWEFRREPWFFTSGGPGSGLFVTVDGGEHWRRATAADGLPEGELGRIGLAVSPSRPEVVYALVEAGRSALVRSDDGGRTWSTVSDRPGIVPRPFYYADLRIDPENENRIYSLQSTLQVSEDGGRSFRTVVPSAIVHGDVHELWIDPADPTHMIVGEDGGIGITWNRGRTWRFVENLALAQFYHIALDDRIPFNVYGGLQDNGSWWGPSDVWENKGILNAHWRRVGGGDGFSTVPDPTDPEYGYSMSQQGSLLRFDRVTGARHAIQPVHPDGIPLRFNWNAALSLDPRDPSALYLGSQFVHRTRDHGASWEILSPDLTTDDPSKQRQDVSGGLTVDATGAENHTTIVEISPSPLEDGVIWVGTDDGNVQLTRDGGATWTEVGRAAEGVPPATWVPDIEPSNHDPATAYLVFDDHRRGNWETYLFRTRDYGATWERLPTEGVDGFAHDLEEDPVEPDLLFLGTEFGLYVSLDRGASWTPWTSNGLPPAPVRESQVHPRDGDLVVGTHGRGAWVVDDIRPLRALAADPSLQAQDVHVFQPPPAYSHEVAEAIGYRSTGHAMWQGETRPYGALISYWLGGPPTVDGSRDGQVRITVRDAGGALVRTLEGPAEPGIGRVVWNLRAGPAAEGDVPEGAEVFPGTYSVSVSYGGQESAADLEVRADPRRQVTMADRRARAEALAVLERWAGTLDEARERIRDALAATDEVLAMLSSSSEDAELRTRGSALRDTLEAVDRRLFSGPDCQGICGGEPLASRVGAPRRRIASTPGAPTPLERLMMEQARSALAEVVNEVNRMLREHVAPWARAVRSAGASPFPSTTPIPLPGGGS